MGLDMYLTAKRYVRIDEKFSQAVAKVLPELKNRRVKQIEAEAAYWRKANAVHKWFVDKVQAGVDDCGTYEVSKAQLTELRDTCRRVLDFRHLAVAQLPPAEGFFFGGNEINEWYWQNLEDTVKMIDSVLADFSDGKWHFEYHSSW